MISMIIGLLAVCYQAAQATPPCFVTATVGYSEVYPPGMSAHVPPPDQIVVSPLTATSSTNASSSVPPPPPPGPGPSTSGPQPPPYAPPQTQPNATEEDASSFEGCVPVPSYSYYACYTCASPGCPGGGDLARCFYWDRIGTTQRPVAVPCNQCCLFPRIKSDDPASVLKEIDDSVDEVMAGVYDEEPRRSGRKRQRVDYSDGYDSDENTKQADLEDRVVKGALLLTVKGKQVKDAAQAEATANVLLQMCEDSQDAFTAPADPTPKDVNHTSIRAEAAGVVSGLSDLNTILATKLAVKTEDEDCQVTATQIMAVANYQFNADNNMEELVGQRVNEEQSGASAVRYTKTICNALTLGLAASGHRGLAALTFAACNAPGAEAMDVTAINVTPTPVQQGGVPVVHRYLPTCPAPPPTCPAPPPTLPPTPPPPLFANVTPRLKMDDCIVTASVKTFYDKVLDLTYTPADLARGNAILRPGEDVPRENGVPVNSSFLGRTYTSADGKPLLHAADDPPGVCWHSWEQRHQAQKQEQAHEDLCQRRLITQDAIRRERAYAQFVELELRRDEQRKQLDEECLSDETLLAVELSNTNSITACGSLAVSVGVATGNLPAAVLSFAACRASGAQAAGETNCLTMTSTGSPPPDTGTVRTRDDASLDSSTTAGRVSPLNQVRGGIRAAAEGDILESNTTHGETSAPSPDTNVTAAAVTAAAVTAAAANPDMMDAAADPGVVARLTQWLQSNPATYSDLFCPLLHEIMGTEYYMAERRAWRQIFGSQWQSFVDRYRALSLSATYNSATGYIAPEDQTALLGVNADLLTELEAMIQQWQGQHLPQQEQCPLCIDPCRDPVTTPCGHTFCSSHSGCGGLRRLAVMTDPSADTAACPMCRRDIFGTLHQHFPDELARQCPRAAAPTEPGALTEPGSSEEDETLEFIDSDEDDIEVHDDDDQDEYMPEQDETAVAVVTAPPPLPAHGRGRGSRCGRRRGGGGGGGRGSTRGSSGPPILRLLVEMRQRDTNNRTINYPTALALNEYAVYVDRVQQTRNDAQMAILFRRSLTTVPEYHGQPPIHICINSVSGAQPSELYCTNLVSLWVQQTAPVPFLKQKMLELLLPDATLLLGRAEAIMNGRPITYPGKALDQRQLDVCCSLVADLGQEVQRAHFVTAITACLGFLDLEFMKKANSKRNTDFLPMQNGALDLATKTLRVYHPDEFVISTRTLTFDYAAADPAAVAQVNTFLAQLQPDPAILKYLKNIMVLMTLDRNFKQGWFLFLGKPNTGKTTFLLMMKSFLGPCMHRSQARALYPNPRADTSGADGTVAQASCKRAWIFEEFDRNKTLDIEKIKEFLGGDDLRARDLYQRESDIVMYATLITAMNELPQFSTTVGVRERMAVVPFTNEFTGAAVDRTLRDDLKNADSPRARAWNLALVDIIADHFHTVLKPEILDNAAVDSIPQPPAVQSATAAAFGELNVVHAWFLSDDCPCVVTDSPDDKIDYPDFAAAWNLEDHDCPGARDFSRLIQLIPRPGGGNVEKITGNKQVYAHHHGAPRRARPFTYVAWADSA
eukprot:SAG25_NODE_93_length_16012_cov_22.660341_10_plen_1556_part_00